MSERRSCFSFYHSSSSACGFCAAQRRCKAVQTTHGYDILAALLEQLKGQLPDSDYTDSDRIPHLVNQLRAPPTARKEPRESVTKGIDLFEPDLQI